MSIRLVAVLLGLLVAARTVEAQDRPQNAVDAIRLVLDGPSGQGMGDALFDQRVIDFLANGVTSLPSAPWPRGSAWISDGRTAPALRESDSFGPTAAELPVSMGHGNIGVLFANQHMTFGSVAGQPLRALKGLVPGVTGGNTPGRDGQFLRDHSLESFVGDLSFESSLAVVIDRTTGSFTYGVTDRVDLGCDVTFARTSVKGSSVLNGTPPGGTAQNLIPRESVQVDGSGIGDLSLRTKVTLATWPAMRSAVAVQLRLPTGDSRNLLGLGATQARFVFVGSGAPGLASPHFNIGYTVTSRDDAAPVHTFNELSYVAGGDVVVTRRLTLGADVVGRTLFRAGTMSYVLRNGDTDYPFKENAALHLLLGAFGAKVLITRNALVTASLLFPLNGAGTKPDVSAVIGLEWSVNRPRANRSKSPFIRELVPK